LMPRSCSAFCTPLTAMFQNPAELLVTKANLYGAAPPPPAAGAAPLVSPDFLQLTPPIAAIAANANARTRPLRMIIVSSPLALYSRSGAFLSLPGGCERSFPGVEHAHVAQRVRPGHRRPGRLQSRQGVRDQLSLDGVGCHLGLDFH